MVGIRRANLEDLIYMQQTNLMCLPENYQLKYYLYHGLSWPHLLHVAETDEGRIVGYVLAKMDEEQENKKEEKPLGGHITSISVHRDYRKLGIAKRLMEICLSEMQEIYDAAYCSLNVRVSNVGALGLYRDVLNFKVVQEEIDYYADNENAYEMRKYFKPEVEEMDKLNFGKTTKKKKGKKQKEEQSMANLVVENEEAKETAEEEKEETKTSTSAAETSTTQSEPKEPEDDSKQPEGDKEKDKSKKKRKKKRH
jgi:peptide alpha-N-acetyltransferase